MVDDRLQIVSASLHLLCIAIGYGFLRSRESFWKTLVCLRSPCSEFNGPATERRLKRTVTIVSCNVVTGSYGDGTLSGTIDSLVNAATLRIDFYNLSVPVIVMRHGNCRTDTFYIWTNFGDYKMGSSFDVSLRPHYQFNPKSSRSSSTSSARGLLYEKYFRNH